ncbi:protein cordon-bleu isoform X2 [Lissotriton helveticus]
MKARAPPPPVPPASRKSQEERKSSIDARMAGDQTPEEVKENMLNRKVQVTVTLPSGTENTATVEGSKAMIDLLVELCSRYHLNPAHHFLEITASETQVPIKFKPNTLIGTLDVHTVHLKEKASEGKMKKPPPRIPEKSVRLVVNFLRTQKTVLRVNPQVPVRELLPAICEKCESSPPHTILLRDNVTKEALDPAKSLNELGVKELYAWDSQKEANRNISVRSDSIDKEKRSLLGIFRVNKRNNKTSEPVVKRMSSDDADEEVFDLTSTSVADFPDSTTVPNSPSVNKRTVALVTSLSLTNISGIAERAEGKKRQAPPPPTAMIRQTSCSEESGEDRQSVQILQASQNDLQKKKRRAPAPPVQAMPNNTVEEKENRRSAIGNGRQVPQKPPRGNTPRAPPRLVLPPPPPYPPPDIMDPHAFQGQPDFSDISEVTLEPGWQVAPGSSIYIDDDDDDVMMDTSEVEEINSVNSCLASEGTTEDSCTLSSQSDSASLDYQSDSTKRHDRPQWRQEDTSETDMTYTATMCPVRNISVNSDDSWLSPQSPVSRDEDLSAVRSGEEDMFITAQFEQTLADLDEDSEGMEDNDYSTSGFSESSPTAEVSSPYQYDDEPGIDVAVAVPVTVIDEIPDFSNYCPERYEEEVQTPKTYAHSKDLKPVGNLIKENNIKVSFDKQSSVIGQLPTNGNLSESRISHSNGSISESTMSNANRNLPVRRSSHENLSLNGITYPHENHTNENSTEGKFSFRVVHSDSVPSHRSSFENEFTAEIPRRASESKDTTGEQTPQACSPMFDPVQNNTGIHFDKNGNRRTWTKSKTEPDLGRIQPTASDEPKAPVLRWQQSYEPKAGLTTFKVVPPKPGVKQYDRGVTLSSSAIKIDELGNLVNPHAPPEKKDTPDTSANDTEGSLLRRAKAFWRSNSSEKQIENSTEEAHKKPLSPTTPTKAHNQDTESKVTVLKEKTDYHQTLPSKMSWRESDLKEFQPPQVLKMPTAAEISRAKGDLSFLKPSKRTSSQYVASAITRYTKTQSQSTEGEPKHEDRQQSVTLEPKEKKCIILSKYTPVERQDEIRGTSQECNSFKNTVWNRVSQSTDSRMEKNTNRVEPFYDRNQTTFSNSINAQFSKPSYRDPIIQRIPGYNASSEAAAKVSNTFLAQRCEANDDVDFLSAQDSQATCLPLVSSGVLSSSTEGGQQNGARTGHAKHSFAVNSGATSGQATENTDNKPVALPRRISLESDTLAENSVFGPKKRFRPVVQKPAQKDTSPHSALMESIQSGEGKQRLRSVQDSGSGSDGSFQKSSFNETENERSALLSAIRSCSGNTRLRKISSSASEELQNIRNQELQMQGKENRDIPPPPIMPPPPPPPSVPAHKPKYSVSYKDTSVNAREELMEAIRSGSSAARLKKVSPTLNTL